MTPPVAAAAAPVEVVWVRNSVAHRRGTVRSRCDEYSLVDMSPVPVGELDRHQPRPCRRCFPNGLDQHQAVA